MLNLFMVFFPAECPCNTEVDHQIKTGSGDEMCLSEIGSGGVHSELLSPTSRQIQPNFCKKKQNITNHVEIGKPFILLIFIYLLIVQQTSFFPSDLIANKKLQTHRSGTDLNRTSKLEMLCRWKPTGESRHFKKPIQSATPLKTNKHLGGSFWMMIQLHFKKMLVRNFNP